MEPFLHAYMSRVSVISRPILLRGPRRESLQRQRTSVRGLIEGGGWYDISLYLNCRARSLLAGGSLIREAEPSISFFFLVRSYRPWVCVQPGVLS